MMRKLVLPLLVAGIGCLACVSPTKKDNSIYFRDGAATAGGSGGNAGSSASGGSPGSGGSGELGSGGSSGSGGSVAAGGSGGGGGGSSGGSGGSSSGQDGSASAGDTAATSGVTQNEFSTMCAPPVWSGTKPADVCLVYGEVCMFGGAGHYTSMQDCMAKFAGGSNDGDACKAGHLCRAFKMPATKASDCLQAVGNCQRGN
jgi:hypothetical protein